MKLICLSVCVIGIVTLGGCATTTTKPTTVKALFKRADKNSDGKVSRTEFEDFMIENMFASFDTNGDGFVTEKEFLADGGTVKTFKEVNVSGTGKITLVEAKKSKLIRNRLAKPFDEADVNHSGYVTWDEFQAARARAQAYVR